MSCSEKIVNKDYLFIQEETVFVLYVRLLHQVESHHRHHPMVGFEEVLERDLISNSKNLKAIHQQAIITLLYLF